jgi:RNA polymerase sigma-70 factor (ECF subfamily)
MGKLAELAVDEKTLIRRARSGSMEALGELYARHGDRVYRVAVGLLNGSADAEDVLQDVFVGLPVALRTFDETRELAPWLAQVTARIALERLRSARRRQQREGAYGREHEGVVTPSSFISTDAELSRALASLPEGMRLVLLLREVEGLPHESIASLLGISPSASAVRLHRALKRLRELLRRVP